MKTDKAMEFNSNKEISDNVGIDSEVQQSGRQKRKPGWLADYETDRFFFFFLFLCPSDGDVKSEVPCAGTATTCPR